MSTATECLMPIETVSSADSYPRKFIEVNDLEMAYVEVGEGDPIVFLHGNPTSSYIWRNIIPYVEHLGRCIAPDLIGMGDSDKLAHSGPGHYTLQEHQEYIDAFFEALGIENNVILVLHDCGSMIGFDWAYRHQHAIKGLVYTEAFARVIPMASMPEVQQQYFKALRSAAGEQMILEESEYLEQLMPQLSKRRLTEEELDNYRMPYLRPGESRRPILAWHREMPIDGQPAHVCAIVENYSQWLPTAPVPKLFFNTIPGVVMSWEGMAEHFDTFTNQTVVDLEGYHFIQEDQPYVFGEALKQWLEANFL